MFFAEQSVHRTLRIQKDVLPYALLVVSRSHLAHPRENAGRVVQMSLLEVRLFDPAQDVVHAPGKGNSNSHGARPVHQIITMIKRIRTSRLSITNSLAQVPDEQEISARALQGMLNSMLLYGAYRPAPVLTANQP